MKKVLQFKKKKARERSTCMGSIELLHLKVENEAFPLQRFLQSQIHALFTSLQMLFYFYIVSFMLLQNCRRAGDQIVKKSCTALFVGDCVICCSILSTIFYAAWLVYFVALLWSWRRVPIYSYWFYLASPTVLYKTNRLDPYCWSVSHYDGGQALFIKINNTDSRRDDPFMQGVKNSQRKS